ncbi:MAG: nuclear transport factor 2 family protein, partial [Myxococcota bacterium]
PSLRLWRFGVDGLLERLEWFDADRVEAALARFDELTSESRRSSAANAAARAMERFERCWSGRDWDGVVAGYAPTHAMDDRRSLFRMRVESRDFLANEQILFALPASSWRSELVATRGDRLALLRVHFTAEADGSGPMDVEMLDLVEVDAGGRRTALVVFDSDALDAAHDELGRRFDAGEGARAVEGDAEPRVRQLVIPPNAAWRLWDSLGPIVTAGDWLAFRARVSPDFKFDDRSKRSLVSGDVELYIRNLEVVRAWPDRRVRRTLLAAPRDDIALERISFSGDRDAAAFEGEFLRVVELDDQGRLRGVTHFDADDRHAASHEMLERAAPSPMVEFRRAVNARDLERMRRALRDDLVFDDRRRTGLGRVVGADAYVSAMAALLEAAPDHSAESLYEIAVDEHGELGVTRSFGTLPEGGEFERLWLRVARYHGGRIAALEHFELDDLEQARARFAELRPDLLRIPPNAASRAMSERLAAIVPVGDWQALRALASPDFTFDDRRKRALVRGGLELYLKSLQVVHSWGELSTSRELLATAGDRLAIERLGFSGGAGGGAFEGAFLRLLALDAEGRVRAVLHFDLDDRRAASHEMLERAAPSPMVELRRAVNARDLERARRALRDDLAFDDHRRTGLGRVVGADAYISAMAALLEAAPDHMAESLYEIAVDEHGELAVTRSSGTLLEGGEFERLFLRVVRYDRGRIAALEHFELDDLERARARFEALRPDSV